MIYDGFCVEQMYKKSGNEHMLFFNLISNDAQQIQKVVVE